MNTAHNVPEWVSLILSIMLLCHIIVVAAWDIYAQFQWGPDATISAVFQHWGSKYPITTLLVGIVLGHVFWPTRPRG